MSSDLDDFDIIVNDVDYDYLLALSLQSLEEELNSEENKNRKSIIENDFELSLSLSQIDGQTDNDNTILKTPIGAKDVVSPQLELTDPNPNIWHLMKDFDDLFFGGVLSKHCIELSWSSRMTRTAGYCAWSPSHNFCSIRLSLPLLQLRSRKDLVETLIHEMIHALLFVTREDDNHESHGKKFHEHMYRINRESGANITVYHDFHDEVKHYLKHVWRCDGRCRTRPPYFGYVRRAMNRKPGPNDYWFKFHEQSCGGTFVKISEPIKENKIKSKEVITPEKIKNKDIRNYLSPTKKLSESTSSQIIAFSGVGFILGSDESKKSSTNSSNKLKSFGDNNSNKSESKANRIDNYFRSDSRNSSATEQTTQQTKNIKSVTNLKTSSDRQNINNNKQIDAFSGKGYVLGRRKSTDTNLSNGKSLVPPLKRPNIKENIEIIQID